MRRVPNRLVRLVAVAIIALILVNNFSSTTRAAAQNLPVFDYPVNNQTLGYEGDYLFRVKPIKDAEQYLWGFFQNDVKIWENKRDEGTLSSNEYGIFMDTPAHAKFKVGTVKVSVRALILGNWTDASVITIYLKLVPNASVFDRVVTGQAFRVVFDATKGKFDDTVYSGSDKTDPLGTLKGGETYNVQYKPQSGEWRVTGFNQETNTILSATYNNASPHDRELSLWGWVFMFSKDGKVLDDQYGLVGHIIFDPPTT